VLEAYGKGIGQLKFSRDGHQLVALYLSWTIRLWDTESAKCKEVIELSESQISDIIDDAGDPISRVSISPCGNLLAISDSPSIRVWDLQEQKDVMVLKGLDFAKRCIEWSPCGGWIAVGCHDRTVRLSQTSNKGSVVKKSDMLTVRDISGSVSCLAWSPTNPLEFATGCRSGSVCVWRIEEFNGKFRVQLVWDSLVGRLTASGT